jgi:hypothetical protein
MIRDATECETLRPGVVEEAVTPFNTGAAPRRADRRRGLSLGTALKPTSFRDRDRPKRRVRHGVVCTAPFGSQAVLTGCARRLVSNGMREGHGVG